MAHIVLSIEPVHVYVNSILDQTYLGFLWKSVFPSGFVDFKLNQTWKCVYSYTWVLNEENEAGMSNMWSRAFRVKSRARWMVDYG